jgi:hypothetical protein
MPLSGAPLVGLGRWATASWRLATLPLILPMGFVALAVLVEVLNCKYGVQRGNLIGAVPAYLAPLSFVGAIAWVLHAGLRRLRLDDPGASA